MINLTHMGDLSLFVFDNIAEYNQSRSGFTSKNLKVEIKNQLNRDEEPEFTDSEMGVYLAEKFAERINNPVTKNALDTQLFALSGNKSAIDNGLMTIANTEGISIVDLRNYYKSLIFEKIKVSYESNTHFRNDVLQRFLAYNIYASQINISTDDQINYIKNDLVKAMDKAAYLALANGFTNNRIDMNTGTKAANDGDSAQFLFLARAILAGYNCSNVDVRSSRYDAVIDYDGHLLKVQVKGISGTEISFRDRDRGGAGINPSANRNKGKCISSKEIDLYVAVDKQFGICYLIPATDIDSWVQNGQYRKTVSSLTDYKENWSMISLVEGQLYPSNNNTSNIANNGNNSNNNNNP